MRVAVAGGTGLIGRRIVEALWDAGHDAVAMARATGVDLQTGEGLADLLEGCEAVVDVTNTATVDAEAARGFFASITRNLLDAEREAGVRHHVVLSIVGVDRVEGNGHYAGKRLQEQIAREGGLPSTIVRATQFFEFAETVVRWTRRGDSALLPPLLIQPLAPRDLARVLADRATGRPADATVEVAGPEPQDLVDMARRALAARGETLRLRPSWRGPFGTEMAGEALLPAGQAITTPTTFEEWLTSPD